MLSNVDRQLLQRCLYRSAGGWEDFVDRYLNLVQLVAQQTARSRSMVLNEKQIEELVSDVFFEIIDNDFAVLRRFRLQSSLATYLTIIARRIITRRLSQTNQTQRRERSIPAEALEKLPQNPNGTGTRDSTSKIETREEIEAAMASLSTEEATAVRMFYLDGMNYRDISTQTGMAENSVGPYLSRAREKMRQSRMSDS